MYFTMCVRMHVSMNNVSAALHVHVTVYVLHVHNYMHV